ncbi:MAG: PQQ-dependent sugar dehydrogenase [Pirellulales bacterium]
MHITKRRIQQITVAWATLMAVVCPAIRLPADDGSSPPKPYGINKRVLWTKSRVIGRPEPPPPFRLERVFPKLKFSQPVYLIAEPDSQHWLVLERNGKIFRFPNDPQVAKAELFMDLGRQAYSLAFHPEYRKNGLLFMYSEAPKDETNVRRVSRFRVRRDQPAKCDPKSEEVILQYESRGHMGGHLMFGPQGLLYVTTGDGSVFADAYEVGQNLGDLRSSILRIDVDHTDPGKPYRIPPDNPFVQQAGARPEIWAFGLRNPWRICFDRSNGRMWIGDVGEDRWEMIYLGKKGGNYGWSVREGSHPFMPHRKPGPGSFESPIVEHPHAEARSIVGGIVYDGRRFEQLRGAYIYGDHMTGKIWGLRYDGKQVTWQQELADSAAKIISFGEDHSGEVLILTFDGEILALAHAPKATTPHRFPRRLSETGLFTSVKDHQPAAGLIPYSVNSPLWSDGAKKERFIALSGASQISYSGRRGWKFPEGAVLVKTFSLEMKRGIPASRRRIETRLLTLQQGEWYGYTYAWNDAQTDAALVPKAGTNRTYEIRDPPSDRIRKQVWHYPSRAECMLCHTRVVNFVLGLTTLQMNKRHDYGAVSDNQLRTLNHLGIFTNKISEQDDKYPRLPDPRDKSADLQSRARSYLHANCAHCHIDEGGGNARMKLEFTNKRDETGIYNIAPQHEAFGIANPRLIAPGDPQRSSIYQRIARRGRGQMPPLASSLVDQSAVDMIAEWIESLDR